MAPSALLPAFSDNDDLFSSAGDVKSQLQTLLDDKEKQLQHAATLGQRVLAQQVELEERIRQLEQIEADDEEARDKYTDLAHTLASWDTENAELSSAFGSQRFLNGVDPSPAPQERRTEPERSRPAASSSAAQSRRAKNAAHRADDVEFAFEIGSGLLNEVRRLQSLLGERDKAIQDMKEEKDDLESSLESIRKALKQQEQSADKFKEENWNLEVSLQEFRAQLTETQATVQRLESEQKRTIKQLASSRDTAEQCKNEKENLQTTIEDLNAKHETDIALARKHAAGLARDKSDLQQTVDSLKVEAARTAKRLPRFGSPLTPNDSQTNDFLTPGDIRDDVFSNAGASTNRRRTDTSFAFGADDALGSDFGESPDASPVKLPFLASNHPTNEIEALQQRLAHAQRQISTLKGTLNREKQMKMEYRRQLDASPGKSGLEDEDEEDYEDAVTVSAPKPRRSTPIRGRGYGRARGRGRMTLTERLMAANANGSPQVDWEDDYTADSSLPPPVPSIPIHLLDTDEQEEEEEPRSPSPLSNRASIASVASIEGMDPAFANILRRTPSVTSIPPNGSPLRESILRRSARGNTVGVGRRARGGSAWQETRPPSIIDQPEDLAAALNLSTSSLRDSQIVEEFIPVETSEFTCQTEPEEPIAIPPPPVMADIAVQIEPEPLPPPPPPPVMSEFSVQTDDEPVVAKSEVAIQHQEVRPLLVDSCIATDPIAFEVATSLASSSSLGRRGTITQDYSILSAFSGDETIHTSTPPMSRQFLTPADDDMDEGEETETGADTETDTDDYEDARQSLLMSTPSASRDDFHSMATMSDLAYSESEDDGESIKASKFTRSSTTSPISEARKRPSFYKRQTPVAYDTKSITADLLEPPESTPPKPEVKEISIQTDEYKAPEADIPFPKPASIPIASPTTPSFSRVGAVPQQFQFVSPTPQKPNGQIVAANIAPIAANVLRESTNGFLRSRSSLDSRRQSIESIASVLDDTRPRLSSSGSLLNPVDKTKPPMMALPPPPRAPPPPGSMPPPSFIPERRLPTTSNGSHDMPPPRPSSPPPPELIQRATTPTFGSALSVPGRYGSIRQHGSSMPPPSNSQSLRQPVSTSSFRSAVNPAMYHQQSLGHSAGKGFSSQSFISEGMSPRSSMSSDHNPFTSVPNHATPSRMGGAEEQQTDPAIIQAITQTMIGEFLYKYTRRAIGKGHGERRHKRFFWVHPYTRTLYWSSADPGSTNVSESSAKSAYVEGVRSVLDPNPMPPGLYQYSVIVSTPQREMKFTAATKERHDIWINALKYLLSRPAGNITSPGNQTAVPDSPSSAAEFTDDDHAQHVVASPQSQRSARSPGKDTWNITPRGQRSRSQLSVRGSVGKRAGTPAAEYLRYNGPDSPYSPTKSFIDIQGLDDDDLDFELHGDSHSENGFEGLENVRACCDGRHTVGHSGHHHHHHDSQGEGDPSPPRPISPSAWSFRSRSRSGSVTSHDGGGLFHWGRGDDGKIRFGSRRSNKTLLSQS